MQVDTILFSLLILRGLCDSQGNVWRCHSNQLYLIEITLLEAIVSCCTCIDNYTVLCFHKLFLHRVFDIPLSWLRYIIDIIMKLLIKEPTNQVCA